MENENDSIEKFNTDNKNTVENISKQASGSSGNNNAWMSHKYWMFASVGLAFILILSLFTSGFGLSDITSNVVKSDDIKVSVSNLLAASPGITSGVVTDIKEQNGLYLVTAKINGQLAELYVSKDGTLLIEGNNVIPISDLMARLQAQQNTGDIQTSNIIPEIGNAPVLGNENAPVTIIEFSDLSCPFCAAAAGVNEEMVNYMKQNDPSWTAPLPEIIKNYADTGKAKLAFKYFPGHGTGEEAMKIAWCANEQDKFWQLHDEFFKNQDDIEDAAKLKEIAKNLGIDMVKLESCLASKKYDSRLTEDTAEGRQAGVSGTPTFYINGVEVSGAQSYEAFKKVIDEELAKA